MKIYRRKDWLDYYFMTTRKNGLFSASLSIPDMDTLRLNACWIGNPEEEKAWEEAIDVPDDLCKEFNTWIGQKGNYEHISEVLKKVLGITQEEIDKVYHHDLDMMAFVNEIAEEGSNFKLTSYEMEELYRNTERYMKVWNGDKERVKKYLIEHGDVGLHTDGALVDVFGVTNPTKRKLLHDFHNHWGDVLDMLIDEAVEKYPDENDFDLAYYYVKDGVNDARNWLRVKEKTAED